MNGAATRTGAFTYDDCCFLVSFESDEMVEPLLSQLDDATQSDVATLNMLYPGEEQESFLPYLKNAEFENPTESML